MNFKDAGNLIDKATSQFYYGTTTSSNQWEASSLTIDKIYDACLRIQDIKPVLVDSPMKFYCNESLLEYEDYEYEEEISFYNRWLAPFSSYKASVEIPFEPWVKTRKVKGRRLVPSKQIFITKLGLIGHPEAIKEIQRTLGRTI